MTSRPRPILEKRFALADDECCTCPAPGGAMRNFVRGPLSQGAEALGGLAVSGSVSLDESGSIDGGSVGVHKGLNTDISISLEAVGVCSIRRGCDG
jgi:hypothetical protein